MASVPRTVAEIREAFQVFFAEKGCTRYASSSLVPENDPTTLFTVAGMAQFKDMFLGRGTHPFTKATTVQKCLRTNDIMNVGRTARHHTFFEMLGNFSFNDYFKKEAIHWAWEFLTKRLQLDPARLTVSVHTIDDEAYRIWHEEIGLGHDKIFRLGDADNFWPASAPTDGPEGPGGCCSEIFWDHQTNSDPKDNLASSTGRFVEIWNLVFPQFNVRKPNADGTPNLEDLGRTNIDTGSGLERVAAVMQGVYNNFDIDVFQIIIKKVVAITGVPYVMNAPGNTPEGERNVHTRRIADHVRAITFCIADGALPGNSDRGYIVRRLIRRATLDIDKLGVRTARLHEIVDSVIEAMGSHYTEIERRRNLVVQTLESEEALFRRTLDKGMDLFQKAMDRQRGSGVFSGDDAFDLVTTHGFPKEIIEELAGNEGLKVDQARFATRWSEFQIISQGGKTVEVFTSTALQEAKPRLGATTFVGYTATEAMTQIALLEVDGKEVSEAVKGSKVRLALTNTPFYAESGGQVGDTGRLRGASGLGDGFEIKITDTQKDDGLFIHSGEVVAGTARLGPVKAEVSEDRRRAITRHHSATHLLHSALNHVLGDHIEQQGSKVSAEELRFDYNHAKALDRQQIEAIETWINQQIAAKTAVVAKEMSIDDAKKLGAKAQFGEKYGATVRVISVGDGSVSREFCGGCHVSNTSDIVVFRILKDEASSAGIRRITAVAGNAAQALANEGKQIAEACSVLLGGTIEMDVAGVEFLCKQFKAQAKELPSRIESLVKEVSDLATRLMTTMTGGGGSAIDRVEQLQVELKRLRKLDDSRKAESANRAVDDVLAAEQTVGGLAVIAHVVHGIDVKSLRLLVDTIRQHKPEAVIVVGAVDGDKALLIAAVGAVGQAKGVKAGNLIGSLAKMVGGGGGGKPDLAQAGGKDPSALPAAIAAVPELVTAALAG